MCYKNMKTCRDYKHCSKSKVKKNTKQEQSKHGPLKQFRGKIRCNGGVAILCQLVTVRTIKN